jgi:UDP:flavonoid glycosyltransferase YjiC (YdhE family)
MARRSSRPTPVNSRWGQGFRASRNLPPVSKQLRVMVSTGFGEGHALPSMALAQALKQRGHDVLVELSERWRDPVLGLGMRFTPATDYIAFPGVAPPEPTWPTVVEIARSLVPVVQDFQPDVVVADLVAPAPLLAAELSGARSAQLIPLVYPVQEPGLPPFEVGLLPPRTGLGARGWRAIEPVLRPLRSSTRWIRRVPQLVEETRAELGLPPLGRLNGQFTTYGAIATGLVMVGTFPQLEYPRRWPTHVRVTGPMRFELPHPDVELPEGPEPLVVIAASTVHSGHELIRVATEALQEEPVRVVATLNRRGEAWSEPVPANATVTDWVSYGQVMPKASLVITSGGHGTVARALSEGVPVLVCPAGAETAENGARVTWAGAGSMLPARFHAPRPVRWAVRRLLSDPRFAQRAREIAVWGREHDGAAQGADLVERYARR